MRVLATLFGPAQMAPEVANIRVQPSYRVRPSYDPCTYGELDYIRNLGGRWVVVGGTYSKARNIVATFTYDYSQNSSLGVGESAGYTYGGFSEQGTSGVTTGFGEDFPPVSGAQSNVHETVFRYGLFRWRCSSRGGGYWANWQTQESDSAAGARSPNTSSRFRATFCVWQQPNSRFRLYSTTAYEFTAGVDIKYYIGIDLSSQTGYDAGAQLSYKVIGNPGRWMCGKSNNPGGQHPPAGLVVAH
jgi:hypothetical protein